MIGGSESYSVMKDVVVGSNPTGRATFRKPVSISLDTGFFRILTRIPSTILYLPLEYSPTIYTLNITNHSSLVTFIAPKVKYQLLYIEFFRLICGAMGLCLERRGIL